MKIWFWDQRIRMAKDMTVLQGFIFRAVACAVLCSAVNKDRESWPYLLLAVPPQDTDQNTARTTRQQDFSQHSAGLSVSVLTLFSCVHGKSWPTQNRSFCFQPRRQRVSRPPKPWDISSERGSDLDDSSEWPAERKRPKRTSYKPP